MSRLAPLTLAVAMAACSAAPSPAATSASPALSATPTTAAPPAARLGVLLARSTSDFTTYRVLLVDSKGRTVASASAPLPAVAGLNLPLVSTSATRVYYTDGNNTIRSLSTSGSTAVVRTLTAGTLARTVFAVSPDDTQIALATLRYTPQPSGGVVAGFTVAHEGIRVEPLGGGAGTLLRPGVPDLRTLDAAFPVGWLDSSVVLGVGPAYVQQTAQLTPTTAKSYELVDPATGATRAAILPQDCMLTGPAVRAGTACIGPLPGSVVARLDWRGSKVSEFRSKRLLQPPAALSPSGGRIAVVSTPDRPLILLTPSSESDTTIAGRPIGWLDDEHLVLAESDPSGGSVAILDTVTGTVTHIGERVETGPPAPFFATVPNDLR